jgi:hypothetical protein
MSRNSARFFQTVVVIFGIAVLAFLLWEPTIEGRNARATLVEIYFHDTFLACAYVASIPFFVGLYQAFTLFGEAGRSGGFSPQSLRALRTIKYCAFLLLGAIAVAEVCLVLFVKGKDDIAGGVFMGLLVALFSTAAAAAAAMSERSLR